MKRLLILAVAALTALTMSGCAELFDRDKNPYEDPFYVKYLNSGSQLDGSIRQALEKVRQNPASASAHNDLGVLLMKKGFPKDAEREFERAVDADSHFYAAWYNLGLVRSSRGNDLGARHAFYRTINYKPGHAAALFQLGLIEEKNQNSDKAVKLYAKAYSINPALLDVTVNPRVLDSNLTHLALIEMYPKKHWRESMQFQPTPAAYREATEAPAVSPQPPAQKIVPPAPPVTDPSQQPAPPTPPATST